MDKSSKKIYPKPNTHGIYPVQEEVKYKNERTSASVSLVEIAENDWRASVHVNMRNCGMGYAPGSMSETFLTREDAFYDGLKQIERYCLQQVGSREEAKKIIAWCKSFNQPRLL